MSELVEVRLLGLPVAEAQQAAEHFDGLLREFSMLGAASDAAPVRLLEIRDELRARFGTFATGPREHLADAIARGEPSVDLTYHIPPAAGPAANDLDRLLDEADDYCRRGDHLLTLAAPEPVVRYRRWFLTEFTRQCAGEPPSPWPHPAAPPVG